MCQYLQELHLQVNTFFKYCVNTRKYFTILTEHCINTCKYWAGEYTLIVGICSFKIQWKMNWRDLTSVKAKFIRWVYAETISLEVHIFCEECHTVNVITRKPICNIYRINLTLSLFTEAIIMMILTFFEMVVFFVVWKNLTKDLARQVFV